MKAADWSIHCGTAPNNTLRLLQAEVQRFCYNMLQQPPQFWWSISLSKQRIFHCIKICLYWMDTLNQPSSQCRLIIHQWSSTMMVNNHFLVNPHSCQSLSNSFFSSDKACNEVQPRSFFIHCLFVFLAQLQRCSLHWWTQGYMQYFQQYGPEIALTVLNC